MSSRGGRTCRRALMVMTLVLLSLNVMAGLLREPDDVGFYTNLGAQRLRERAMFPYGDPLLTNTPGATYSPILYFSHLAYQVMLVPVQNPPDPRPEFGVYVLPPILASQLATVTFHILGVVGLFIAARRLIGDGGAWGVDGALLRQRLRDGRRRRSRNDQRDDVRVPHCAGGRHHAGLCGVAAADGCRAPCSRPRPGRCSIPRSSFLRGRAITGDRGRS